MKRGPTEFNPWELATGLKNADSPPFCRGTPDKLRVPCNPAHGNDRLGSVGSVKLTWRKGQPGFHVFDFMKTSLTS